MLTIYPVKMTARAVRPVFLKLQFEMRAGDVHGEKKAAR